MSKFCPSSLHLACLTGLLRQTPGTHAIAALCGASKSTIAARMAASSPVSAAHLRARAEIASQHAYLAFDYTLSFHSGREMEGLSYNYSSSHKSVRLGQRYASVALVNVDELPVPVSLTFAVSKELATVEYAYLTPAQQLIQTVTAFKQAGLTFSGTLVDAEFGSKEVVLHFVKHGDALLVRMKCNCKIRWGGHDMKLADLAKHIPRSMCHHYQQLCWRAKRVPVEFEGHSVDVLVIWRNVNGRWQVFFLLSTFDQAVSLGELIRAWKARWGIEVVHRYIKQQLSFGHCQYRNIRAHQYWADLAVDAFNRIVSIRKKHPLLSWNAAQLQAAEESFNAVWTAIPLDLNALEAA